MDSSSFRMVRLAMVFPTETDSNASNIMQALQSQLPDSPENPDKGDGDDPERQGTPPALAALGPAHRRDRLRRQRQSLTGHGFQLFQHGHRPGGDGRKRRHHAAKLAGTGHGALNAPDRPEIALDPFAHDG